MASVYRREGTRFLWGLWSDAQGKRHRESLDTEDETEARAMANGLERLARGSDAPAAAPLDETTMGVIPHLAPPRWIHG